MSRSVKKFDATLLETRNKSPGWVETEGSVLANPRIGVHLIRVLMMNDDNPLYDTVLRVERGGGVFVPVDERGRIGLLQVWRPQTRDQTQYAASFPALDMEGLGRISFEIPRGMGEPGESGAHAAKREAEEETGGRVVELHDIGPICDNTTFCPHLTEVAWGRINISAASASPDAAEGIVGGLCFFTHAELAVLQREGKLYDGFTLAALALLWIQNPELLMEAKR